MLSTMKNVSKIILLSDFDLQRSAAAPELSLTALYVNDSYFCHNDLFMQITFEQITWSIYVIIVGFVANLSNTNVNCNVPLTLQ